MSKAIIISGGELEEGFVETVLSENEGASIVGVDKGVEYLYHHQIIHYGQHLLIYQVEKQYTIIVMKKMNGIQIFKT